MKIIIEDVDFNIEDIVYFKTDPNQDEYMVTGYEVRKNHILYIVSSGCNTEVHAQSFELSTNKIIK